MSCFASIQGTHRLSPSCSLSVPSFCSSPRSQECSQLRGFPHRQRHNWQPLDRRIYPPGRQHRQLRKLNRAGIDACSHGRRWECHGRSEPNVTAYHAFQAYRYNSRGSCHNISGGKFGDISACDRLERGSYVWCHRHCISSFVSSFVPGFVQKCSRSHVSKLGQERDQDFVLGLVVELIPSRIERGSVRLWGMLLRRYHCRSGAVGGHVIA